MTTISGVGAPSGANTGGKGPGSGGQGFSVPAIGSAAVSSVGRPAAVPAVMLGGILALQESDAEPLGDREARRRGRALLAALGDLQRSILGGAQDPDLLLRLRDLSRPGQPAEDPDLQAVVEAVALRARVELARRGY